MVKSAGMVSLLVDVVPGNRSGKRESGFILISKQQTHANNMDKGRLTEL